VLAVSASSLGLADPVAVASPLRFAQRMHMQPNEPNLSPPSSRLVFLAFAALLLFLPSCSGGEDVENGGAAGTKSGGAGAPPPAAIAQAREIYAARCVACHGETGAGNGPGAAALDPKPRDFRLPDWQKSVTDDHIKKVVLYGGAAVGKSPLMVPNPDLKGNEHVLNALVSYVRSLEKK
jgi:mono/diheme cytochrome c family protein